MLLTHLKMALHRIASTEWWCLQFRVRATVRNSLIKLVALLTVGFSCGSAGKESPCNAGYLGSIPALGRSPGEGKGYPLQYSGLENSMDYTVHGVAKSQTRLSDFHFHFYVNCIDITKDVFVTLHNFLCLSGSHRESLFLSLWTPWNTKWIIFPFTVVLRRFRTIFVAHQKYWVNIFEILMAQS